MITTIRSSLIQALVLCFRGSRAARYRPCYVGDAMAYLRYGPICHRNPLKFKRVNFYLTSSGRMSLVDTCQTRKTVIATPFSPVATYLGSSYIMVAPLEDNRRYIRVIDSLLLQKDFRKVPEIIIITIHSIIVSSPGIQTVKSVPYRSRLSLTSPQAQSFAFS